MADSIQSASARESVRPKLRRSFAHLIRLSTSGDDPGRRIAPYKFGRWIASSGRYQGRKLYRNPTSRNWRTVRCFIWCACAENAPDLDINSSDNRLRPASMESKEISRKISNRMNSNAKNWIRGAGEIVCLYLSWSSFPVSW